MKIQRVNQQLIFTPLNRCDPTETEISVSKFIKETKVKSKNPETSLIMTLTPGVVFNTLPFLSTRRQKAEVCANLLDYLSFRLEKYTAQIVKGETPASVFIIASYCLNHIWGTYSPNKTSWPSPYYASANRFCSSLVKTAAEAHSVTNLGETVSDLFMINPTFRPPRKTTFKPWYDNESGTAKESAIRNNVYKIIRSDPLTWIEELGFFLIWLSKATIVRDVHSSKKRSKTGN